MPLRTSGFTPAGSGLLVLLGTLPTATRQGKHQLTSAGLWNPNSASPKGWSDGPSLESPPETTRMGTANPGARCGGAVLGSLLWQGAQEAIHALPQIWELLWAVRQAPGQHSCPGAQLSLRIKLICRQMERLEEVWKESSEELNPLFKRGNSLGRKRDSAASSVHRDKANFTNRKSKEVSDPAPGPSGLKHYSDGVLTIKWGP